MTTTLPKENLRILTFTTSLTNSDGKPISGTKRKHNLVFNCTVITEEEIDELIQNDSWELDDRVIDIPTCILQNLQDKNIDNIEENNTHDVQTLL